jgi:hypothetical protein
MAGNVGFAGEGEAVVAEEVVVAGEEAAVVGEA